MKRSIASICLSTLVLGAMALPLVAGDKDQSKPASAPVMSPEMAQAMQRMEAYGALNENHAYLKQFEGEWDCTSKWWMSEGATPVENKCSSTAKVSFDGHFLIEKYTGNFTMGEGMPPQPFQGMCTMGYDNHRKQFVNTWIDNWTSGMMTEYGSASEGGRVFTFEGENYCCMNDKICKSKSVITFVNPDTRKMEMWAPGLDGKVYKAMEMTLTHKK
ncbi:MAG: DUF1579 domain-containing protein [Phycisphaerae bacterium]|nr:DUF1579 domain-containing protein [Phycisphaerae bacterium]